MSRPTPLWRLEAFLGCGRTARRSDRPRTRRRSSRWTVSRSRRWRSRRCRVWKDSSSRRLCPGRWRRPEGRWSASGDALRRLRHRRGPDGAARRPGLAGSVAGPEEADQREAARRVYSGGTARMPTPCRRRQVMEDALAQGRENPAFALEHAVFDQGFVAGLSDAGREALNVIVFEQIGVGLVEDRLVARLLDHCRLDVVGHHDLRHAAHVLEAAHVRGAPVLDLLAERRLGEEPPGDPHRGHEHLRLVLEPPPRPPRRTCGS